VNERTSSSSVEHGRRQLDNLNNTGRICYALFLDRLSVDWALIESSNEAYTGEFSV
jgi:hypothetical protein